jgi:glycine/D-amino acid oxidase-like deaminating enzyme
VWVNYDDEAIRRELGNFKYSLRLEKNEDGYSDPRKCVELGLFDDAAPARRAILALVAAHSHGNLTDAATGARRVDASTAMLLHELGRKTLDLPEGSRAQVDTENEFHQIGLIFLDDPQRQQFEEWAVKATTPERVSALLTQLSLPALSLESTDDMPPGAAPP